MKAERYETLEEATAGLSFPDEVRAELELADVEYLSFENDVRIGQLVLNRACVDDVLFIFNELKKERFPIEKIVPIIAYGWDDERSMQENNTSAFNYRNIIGTDILSRHSLGKAIDINPRLNPYYALDGNVYPADLAYKKEVPGTITADSLAVKLFEERGWMWLGKRDKAPDYQHFEKPN